MECRETWAAVPGDGALSWTARSLMRLSDVDVAAIAARGDVAAKRVVADRLFSSVRAMVHYLAPRDRDADDIVQMALIEILRSCGTFRGECRLEVWAYRIAVRTAMRHLKDRRARHRLAEQKEHQIPVEHHTPEHCAEQVQLRHRIKAHLGRLPVAQRTAVVLRFVHGLRAEEIAETLEIPLNTARERLRVGRKKLRKLVVKDRELAEWIGRMGS